MEHDTPAGSSYATPRARQEDLVVSMSGGEAIVFDTRNNHVHRLDETCTIVWSLLDGRRTIPTITREAGLLDVEVTRFAIRELHGADLVDGHLSGELALEPTSRRRLIKRAAMVAGAPLIVSITAPAAAVASSLNCTVEGTFSEDPNCCNAFRTCANGVWVTRSCGPGTVWNQSLLICDWQNAVDCGARPIC